MYGVTSNKKHLKNARIRLNVLYNKIPSTKGCMEHISKSETEGGCNAWCCRQNNPQVLYVEFLNTWKNVSANWTDEQVLFLLEKCLRKYLFPEMDRGCVFLDKDKNICSQHETRPLSCRTYGIEPEEEFKPKYERLKIIYPETKYQCNLVKTENEEIVTKKNIDNWWLELCSIEMSIGINKENISDKFGGSYRTYNDHLLIHFFGEKVMEDLTTLRLDPLSSLKEATIKGILSSIKKFKER
jgi:Fe-S-cluster containining protein